jgi:hypothetical protein
MNGNMVGSICGRSSINFDATQHKTQKTLKNKKANSKFNYVKRNLINTFNCKYLTYLYPIKNKIYKD